MKRILLWILAIVLTLISLKSPQGLIFPMWILVYLYKENFKAVVDRFPLPIAFILSGLFFGLCTESFAILHNIHKPITERILLYQASITGDLLMAFFYYILFIVTWYILLRKIRFSKTAVFIVSGIFGIFSEQGGAVLYGIFANPFIGSLVAFLVMSVYGIFPLLAYTLTKERFIGGKKPHAKHYLIAAGAFFVFWAIYGNFVHKALLSFLLK